jgi:hypothetical protein
LISVRLEAFTVVLIKINVFTNVSSQMLYHVNGVSEVVVTPSSVG